VRLLEADGLRGAAGTDSDMIEGFLRGFLNAEDGAVNIESEKDREKKKRPKYPHSMVIQIVSFH
jgi:hypothetical protein